MQLNILNRPLLLVLVIFRVHVQLAFLRASKNNQVKVDIGLQWLDFSIAVHNLKVRAKSFQDKVVLLHKVQSLMIDSAVHD